MNATKLLSLGTLAFAGLAVFHIAMPEQGAAILILPANAQQSHTSATTVAVAGVTLHSDSVDLPISRRAFTGPDAQAINSNCLTCHSAGMVLAQPPMNRAAWHAEVEKMQQQFKAPVPDADVPAIVAWLVAHKGD